MVRRLYNSIGRHREIDEQHRQRIAESVRKYWQEHPKELEAMREKNRVAIRPPVSDVTREKLSLIHEGTARPDISMALMGHEGASDLLVRYYELHPETRETIANKLRGHQFSEESKRMMSESHKRLWEDGDFVAYMMARRANSPNAAEIWLNEVLETRFPGIWEFNGKGPLIVERHVPDFIDKLGKRWLIEIFGEYWHNVLFFPWRLSEGELIDLYDKNGYKCLVIWECDLVSDVYVRIARHFNMEAS